MNLDQFVANENLRNAWIRERDIDVYVRRSIRMLHRSTTATPCLDIASVEVREDRRGQGVFKAFLTRFEKEAKKINRAVYVESILEPRLVTFLTARGYSHVKGSEQSQNMFKILS